MRNDKHVLMIFKNGLKEIYKDGHIIVMALDTNSGAGYCSIESVTIHIVENGHSADKWERMKTLTDLFYRAIDGKVLIESNQVMYNYIYEPKAWRGGLDTKIHKLPEFIA